MAQACVPDFAAAPSAGGASAGGASVAAATGNASGGASICSVRLRLRLDLRRRRCFRAAHRRRRFLGDRRGGEGLFQLAAGIDRLLDGLVEIELRHRLDLLAHLLELELADHLVETALELAGDRPGAPNPHADGAQHARQILGADDQQRHHADQ